MGRPALDKVRISLKLSREVAEKVDAARQLVGKDRSAFIELAVVAAMEGRKPKGKAR